MGEIEKEKGEKKMEGDNCGMKSGGGGAPAVGQEGETVGGEQKNGCHAEAGEERGGRGAGREEGWRVVMMDALLSFRAP